MKYTGRSAQWGLFIWKIMASHKKRLENLQKNHYSSPSYKYLTIIFIHPLPGHDVHHQWDSDKTASLRKGDVSTGSSSLRDVSRGGTSATQWRKFHTDDVNQYLHNKSCSHGVPNVNLFDFTFLLVDFGKVLCSSVNELQQNSNASAIFHKYWLFCLRFIVFTFDLCRLLSFICHS